MSEMRSCCPKCQTLYWHGECPQCALTAAREEIARWQKIAQANAERDMEAEAREAGLREALAAIGKLADPRNEAQRGSATYQDIFTLAVQALTGARNEMFAAFDAALAAPGASPATLDVPIPSSVATLEDTVRHLTRRVAELEDEAEAKRRVVEAAKALRDVEVEVRMSFQKFASLDEGLSGRHQAATQAVVLAVDALAHAEASRGEAPRGEEG